jgi:N-acetylglucosaminyldiphosphoundecaprenol N-acetyl-beta-D-mannosaminyltransferase
VVALGAKKGQAWILKNLHNIKIPLVSHLGAVINFEAKRLKRAPVRLQKIGLEWAWRIKEEPHLWRRYWNDGRFFLKILATKIFPHVIWLKFNKQRLKQLSPKSSIILNQGQDYSTIMVSGVVYGPVTTEMRSLMRQVSLQNKNVRVDLSAAEYLDLGFFGLLLMLKKNLDKQGGQMELIGVQSDMKKLLDWIGLSYLVK